MIAAAVTTSSVLCAVRARLLSHGWTPGGSRCLLLTFDRVVDDADWKTVGRPAWEGLRTSIGVPSLVAWNDADQELPDVIAAIDRALDQLVARSV